MSEIISNTKEILEQMSKGFTPKLPNPFTNISNNPSYNNQYSKDKFNNEASNFHSMIKNTINSTGELEILADQLRQNVGFGDYDECLKLTNHPKFFDFCNLKDDCGFNALDYSISYGHNKIHELLIETGLKSDSKNISDFINIGNTDDIELETHYNNDEFNFSECDSKSTDSFVEIKKKSSVKKENEGGLFSKNFAKSMQKNFAKNGFSENRSNDKPFKVPERAEVTPEQIDEMMLKMNTNQYALRNNEFLEQYSSRDVSKLLIKEPNIDVNLLEHRNRMLPPSPVKSDLINTIKSCLKLQIGYVSKKNIEKIVDKVYEKLIFYRDMFLRLIPINNVVVKPSLIHGQGIFATKQLKKGEIITFYFPYFLEHVYTDTEKKQEGIILVPVISRRSFTDNNDELSAMRKGSIKIDFDFFLVGDDKYIGDQRFLGHLANDPCDFSKGNIDFVKYEKEIIEKANASVVSYSEDRKFIYLVATKTIKIDEEILVPYGANFWEIPNNVSSAYN